MGLNKQAVGAVGTAFALDVERGKVREFARAVQCDHAGYLSGEHPVIPPTFLTTMFFWEEGVPGANPWAQIEMSQERGMHAEQEYVFYGEPPRAGDKLTCTSRIQEIYEKQGRRGGTLTFAVMVTEFRNEAGELVAEGRLTGVETAQAPEDER